MRGGGLVTVGDDLFYIYGSADSESVIPRENGHLAGRDIRPCCYLSYLFRDGPWGFLFECRQRCPRWLGRTYSNHARFVFLRLQEASFFESRWTPDGHRQWLVVVRVVDNLGRFPHQLSKRHIVLIGLRH